LKKALNTADLREMARRRLPRGIFEFVDRGTEDEIGLAETVASFSKIKLMPRPLVDVSRRSTESAIFGAPVSLPLIVAPTGAGGLCAFDGDMKVARAAASARVPFGLAIGSIASMERVFASAPQGRNWFQLYMFQERNLTFELARRAQSVGYEAVMLTVDQTVPAKREYNQRNGFDAPFQINVRAMFDAACSPGWLFGVLGRHIVRGGMPRHENYPEGFQRKITSDPKLRTGMANDTVTWDDVSRLRDIWHRKLIVKGVMRVEDALACIERGVDGIVISNHGGRSFDSAPPPIAVLPRIAEAVKGRISIFYDSGIRRGSDIAKAIALGADAVLTGRVPLYGVAAGGQAGVEHAIEILRKELDLTLAYLGCNSIGELSPDLVFRE
jgi:isopentenyl diphosphate isomerase/L-lactate dehydrogenase-like FMN-dependent dehydrogenase